MSTPWPPAVWERIDAACDRFEAAWKSGRSPELAEFVSDESDSVRELLVRELRRVDEHYRQRTAARDSRTSFAGFEVLEELGRGGMGVVFKARQLRPQRLVALKMISRGAEADAQDLERFRREAEAVAQLQHPHIVQVYEVGDHEGRPYVALEYVAGGSLDQHLRATPQPPRVAAALVERLADAIQHAHTRGIIHRDLKPANVLLHVLEEHPEFDSQKRSLSLLDPRHSTPKITDFGLAKLIDVGSGSPTRSGDVLGTPSYMAPEQVGGGQPISAATDVYGLGAILYELLTGRPPFRGETALETIQLVQTAEPVSPSRLHPRCPRDLVTICLKCVQKAPQDRYPTAADLAADLRRFLDRQPIRARPVGPLRQGLKWARRQPVIATLAALLLAAVTLGVATGSWYWRQAALGRDEAKEALTQQRAAQSARVATLGRYQIALAHREWLANNARRAEALLDACTPEQRDSWEWRYLDRLRHAPLKTLSGHRNTAQSIAVHPSGGQIASVSHDATVRLWDLESGQSATLGTLPTIGMAVAYSPNGELLAAADGHTGTIKIWSVASREPAMPDLSLGGREETPIRGLAFDPSSRYLAIGAPQHLKVFDLQTRTWIYDRTAGGNLIFNVAFSPDGRLIATAAEKIRVWDWLADQQLHEWPGHGPLTHDLAFSPDGTRLATGGRDGLIRVHSLLPEIEPFTLNAHRLAVTSVEFSPDGSRLASSGQEGDMHVWDLERRKLLHTLHGHSGAVWDLAYTTDGKRLISCGSDFLLRIWDANRTPEAEVLPLSTVDEVRALAYGGGGRFLAWCDVRGRVGVWDFERQACAFRHDEPDAGKNPFVMRLSRDGRQLAYRGTGDTVKLWDIEQKKEILLPKPRGRAALGFAFTPDGSKLLDAEWSDGSLRATDLRTGQPQLTLPLSDAPLQVVWDPSLSIIATVEDRKHVRLWDAITGAPRGELDNLPSVSHLAFTPEGRYLALGGVGGRMCVWDLVENRELMSVTGHASNLYGLALSPDGRRLASAASDCTAKLWDVRTGEEVLALRTDLHEHSPLAFSPDGADLAAVDSQGQIQIWSTRRRAE